jgi:diguanylate cyclase (GGDEF)-like protein
VLEDIRELGDALCCEILLVDSKESRIEKYCSAMRSDNPFINVDIDEVLPYDLVKTWEKLLQDSNCVIVKNDRDIESLSARSPEWARSLGENGVDSLILLPLYQNKSVFGYLYMTNFNTDKVVELKEVMELISFFLGTEISNTLLHERMNLMLRTDTLTGANNRYAMLDRIAGLKGKSFGIISLDLNGLKRMNDTYGHDAGDRLLVQAAEVLSKVFYEEDIFRTGGDEFVVISADITEGVFDRKLARLRRDAEKNVDVSFAMGSFWSDGTVEPSEAFRIADDNMYKDKREYYLSHPELSVR